MVKQEKIDYEVLRARHDYAKRKKDREYISKIRKEHPLNAEELENALDYNVSPEAKEKGYMGVLVNLNETIKRREFMPAYKMFNSIKRSLYNEKTLSPEKVNQYHKSLARRVKKLVDKTTTEEINKKSELQYYKQDAIDYYNEKLKDEKSGLEKTLTALSLGSIIAGIILSYPSMTGNVVAENSGRFFGAGMSLFLLGLFGIWITHK